jgi:hypothetical protein
VDEPDPAGVLDAAGLASDVPRHGVSPLGARTFASTARPSTTDRVPTPHPDHDDDDEARRSPGGHAAHSTDPGAFARLIGLVIFGLAAIAAALLLLAAGAVGPRVDMAPTEGLLFGLWSVLYATEAPSPRVALASVALAALLAAVVALVELRISNRSRRSSDAQSYPLAPKLVMARTYGVFAGPVTITVLIPAHNEEVSLPGTIASLVGQSHPPERIIVVADNCTDGTESVARAHNAEVFVTVGNADKKAGALNQALRRLLGNLGDNDIVMCIDADTVLDEGFFAAGADACSC